MVIIIRIDVYHIIRKNLTVQLAVVICGTRLQEGLMMLKSAAVFTLTKLHFHVFAEDHLHIPIRQRLNEISVISQNTITYDVLPIKFPKDNADIWKKLFKPCSCQRLFLPYLLKKTDSLIYLDTDILFMRPPEDLWNFFNKFNATQLVAVSPEGEDIRTSWYNKFAQHPYYGKLGINSDVILMNLTRMRKANWNDKVTKVYQKYRSSIVLGDQDILNAIFHFHPEMVYVLTCAWNYRPDHCRYGRNDCKHAYKNGVSLLHGDRQTFHKNDFPSFRIVYEVIQNYDFKTGVTRGIYNPLKRILPMVQKSYCSRIWESMIMILKRYRREHKL
ncbi:uncharacterized protein TRIADDRAFT_18847 [Trichoplax adhaerens]|uniref:UDP-D-xylose:beta-D-glucoside alpha-1,3-D-xylosyltransferase n=1 Tax=Trichoplax adhaerens TaxID=10228 RepID=B3RL56_TRIAD|nr:hypothetical protein TRIADDRAFT_18847 [Trichoplax adhaerens]EDV28705.1 hypothetical protein TRIADDRAFT_18847 [Trichoplax adhaerens]|eukprot:XP_002107907.1 hypothetical protein TRIADDRAFT_18847 [Trichoplax adhaerens]